MPITENVAHQFFCDGNKYKTSHVISSFNYETFTNEAFSGKLTLSLILILTDSTD